MDDPNWSPTNGRLDTPATLRPPPAGSEEPAARPGVGAGAPPPPPTEADGLRARLAEADEVIARWENWAERVAASKTHTLEPEREPSKLSANLRRFPKRYAVHLCIAGAIVVSYTAVRAATPRLSEEQITANAAMIAGAQAKTETSTAVANAAARATQVVVPDPFAAYGRELTEDAKTAIGYDASTGGRTLQPARAQYVADQVKAALASQGMKLDEMRLSSTGPSQLSVHNNPAQGFALFKPPATRAPDSMTTSTTGTSAP